MSTLLTASGQPLTNNAGFAIHVKGASVGTKVFTHKSTITGEKIDFYPERGMITLDGSMKHQEFWTRESRKEFLLRALAINAAIPHNKYAGEKLDDIRLVEQMKLAARAAGEQGDPFTHNHLVDMCGQRLNNRVAMPHSFDFGIPDVPQADPAKPIKHVDAPVDPKKAIIVAR